jgi:hypothetical protein
VSRRALAALALALALTGCETTAEKSARLEKAALRSGAAQHANTQGLRIAHPSTQVRVVASTLVHGSEGYAAAVTVRNDSATALRDIPIAIWANDAGGATVYSNTAPGLGQSLISVPYLAPHGELTWVDDQVQATTAPSSLKVELGQGTPVTGAVPSIVVAGVRQFEDPANGAGAEGMVGNRSAVAQRELVVYAVARRGGAIVAAGRAVVPQLPAAGSVRFQAYLVGSPAGAVVQASAPPATIP